VEASDGLRVLGVALAAIVLTGTAGAQPWLPLTGEASLERQAQAHHGSGAGLLVDGDYAYATGLGDGLAILDVSDPQAPETVARHESYARDVALLDVGERTLVATATDPGSHMNVLDVTDPENPTFVESVDVGTGTHNVAAVEDGDLFYNSGSSYSYGIEIVDASDPGNPELVKTWEAIPSCHDIETYPDEDRAYCAGRSATFLLDIADPLEPEVLGKIDDEQIRLHHWAVATPDHRTLIVGDEDFSADEACGSGTHTPVASVGGDDGALWFYDITVPSDPVQVGKLTPPEAGGSGYCTSHFGDMVEGTSLLATGWYGAGVVLVDTGDPGYPTVVEQWNPDGVDVWDVQHRDGYLYTGDRARGMDVLELDLSTTTDPVDEVP
jgi:hypothetical protein